MTMVGDPEDPVSPVQCVDPTDIPYPVPSPIPRVILASGIKAIADSRIAASCKKSADKLDPLVVVLR